MNPTIGRIVLFRLTAEQAEQVNRRRTSPGSIAERISDESWRHWPEGAQAQIGNSVAEGTVVPMIITAVWPDEFQGGAHLFTHDAPVYQSTFGVNGQAFLDGTDSLWVTSAPQHETLTGCWFWPPRS